jgi:O-antigen/teichoic acid export membrane protein
MWFFVCAVLQRGISTITTPIFTRILSSDEFGQFSVFSSWLSVLGVLVTLQLVGGVFITGLVKFKEDARVFASSLQGLTLTLCLAWTIVYLLFRNFWNSVFSLTTVQMLAMLIIIWSTAVFSFWMTEQRNAYKYKLLIVVTLMVSLAKPALGVLLILCAEDKVTARILGLMIVELVFYTGFFFAQVYRGKKFFSAKYWKYAILFNLPLLPHYLSNSVLSSSDRIMIQRIIGDSAAGIYSLAYSISLVMHLVSDSLNKTMSPWLYQKIGAKDYNALPKAVYPSLILIGLANLFLIAVAPEAVALFAPREYYDAIYVIPPVAMSVYVGYLYLCFCPFEFYYEKTTWTTIGTLTSAVSNIILNAIFIPVFGYYAAGYTTLVSYLIHALMHYHFMRKVCKMYLGDIKPYNSGLLIGMTGIFMAIGFLYIPTYSNIYVRYALTMVLAIILFLHRKKLMLLVKESFIKRN